MLEENGGAYLGFAYCPVHFYLHKCTTITLFEVKIGLFKPSKIATPTGGFFGFNNENKA